MWPAGRSLRTPDLEAVFSVSNLGLNTQILCYDFRITSEHVSLCVKTLSRIRTLGPSSFLTDGKKTFSNQSSKQAAPNHPFLERLYRAPSGPFSIQVDHICSALYTTYGGKDLPSALPHFVFLGSRSVKEKSSFYFSTMYRVQNKETSISC